MTPALPLPDKKLLGQTIVGGYGLPVICLFGSLILLLVTVRPTFTKIQELRVEQAEAERRSALLDSKVQQLEKFASIEDVLDPDFDLFSQAVPFESDVPALLTQIQTIANQARVKIAVLQFGGEIVKTAEAGFEVRIKFSSKSSGDRFRELLRLFEKATRIIDVESLRYRVAAGEGGALALQADLNLISYYTQEPILSPEAPLALDLTDPAFERNSEVLKSLTPYEGGVSEEEVPEEEETPEETEGP